MHKILVMNGPNLNMLGKRPENHYGSLTLEDINSKIKEEASSCFELEFYQSNYEGDLVTKIQNSLDCFAIIINPAAYTHTSVAIRDALEIFKGIKIEVHLSHVDEREDFRKINFVRDVCDATFSGKQVDSYLDAIKYLKNRL
ncbi:MAG: 3-dehydroquinate dehydratase [Anaeroplasmataceae bacterium]|nr:3-dehydroquinate dehydratase [Anaeroplasmataceae bacterium]